MYLIDGQSFCVTYCIRQKIMCSKEGRSAYFDDPELLLQVLYISLLFRCACWSFLPVIKVSKQRACDIQEVLKLLWTLQLCLLALCIQVLVQQIQHEFLHISKILIHEYGLIFMEKLAIREREK